MLVALAAKSLAGLATGLRKKFGQYAGHVSIICLVLVFKFCVDKINCGIRIWHQPDTDFYCMRY